MRKTCVLVAQFHEAPGYVEWIFWALGTRPATAWIAMAWESDVRSPEEIQSRIAWYINENIRGRRAAVARATKFSTSTLDRYCDYKDTVGLGSLKFLYIVKILRALGENPSMVFLAAETANSPQEMRYRAAKPMHYDDENVAWIAGRQRR